MSLKSYKNLSNILNSKKNQQTKSDTDDDQERGNSSRHFSRSELDSIIITHVQECKENNIKCNWKKISQEINYQLNESQLNNKAKYLRSKLKNLN